MYMCITLCLSLVTKLYVKPEIAISLILVSLAWTKHFNASQVSVGLIEWHIEHYLIT